MGDPALFPTSNIHMNGFDVLLITNQNNRLLYNPGNI